MTIEQTTISVGGFERGFGYPPHEPSFFESSTRDGVLSRKRPKGLSPTNLKNTRLRRWNAYTVVSTGGPWPDDVFLDAISQDYAPLIDPSATAFNRAVLDVRKNIKDETVNLAVVLGEYAQTCDLFLETARRVYTFVWNLRRVNLHSAVSALNLSGSVTKDVANQYLEIQYGWKPLLQDIDGSCRALADILYGPSGIRRRSIGIGKESSSNETRTDVHPYWGDHDAAYLMKGSALLDRSCKIYADYEVKAGGLASAKSLGFTNPASVAYELIPYSFVVDWLFPVGSWLSSLDALVGIENSSYVSVERSKDSFTLSLLGSRATAMREVYDRRVLSDLPVPGLTYQPSTSVQKVFNGLALLRQLR